LKLFLLVVTRTFAMYWDARIHISWKYENIDKIW